MPHEVHRVGATPTCSASQSHEFIMAMAPRLVQQCGLMRVWNDASLRARRLGPRCAVLLVAVAGLAGPSCKSEEERRESSPPLPDDDVGVVDGVDEPDPSPGDDTLGGGSANVSDTPRPSLGQPRETRLVNAFETEAEQDTPRAANAQGLGGACKTTADCRAGLGCADVAFSGSNQPYIAGGYCSRWCEDSSDCAALEPESYCEVGLFGTGLNLCLKTCVSGELEDGSDAKCGGRADLACGYMPAPGIVRQCGPRCASDAQCETGRCNPYTGLCDTRLTNGPTPVGALCTGNTASFCNGSCGIPCYGNCGAPWNEGNRGLCVGSCQLGSTCGEGPGTVCAAEEYGLRPGDGGKCQPECDTSADCEAGYTACAPTGLLLPSGEPQKGCTAIYREPTSIAPQRLSVEQMPTVNMPGGVLTVSTSSIFLALSHRLHVEDGAVCVTGSVSEGTALIYLDFQFRPNNGPAFDASNLSALTFDAAGPHVVRLDIAATGREYRFLSPDPRIAGDVGEGPQRIGFDQLFDIYAGNAPFLPAAAAELEALRFSVILDEGPGPFRYCMSNLAFEASAAPL